MANEPVLLVEDNEDRLLMRDVLAFKGYRLAEADRAKAASGPPEGSIPISS